LWHTSRYYPRITLERLSKTVINFRIDGLWHGNYTREFQTRVKTRSLSFVTIPNVVVKWLTLLLRNREVPSLNLGQETGYPDCSSWISSVPLGKCRGRTLN
jgi:hypothetical protein